MTKEYYSTKISTSTPLGLIIINYELAMHNIHHAKENCENGEYEDFEMHIKKAQAYLMVLMSSLDMTFDISKDLLDIYLYVNKILARSVYTKNTDTICEACDILGSLLDSWRMISQAESKETAPVMENVEQLIAGLTYKNGELCEYIVGGENRGIKA